MTFQTQRIRIVTLTLATILFFFRYFVLDHGLLTYGKTQAEVSRGRTHGRIDVGLAVISAKTELFRIDIDDEVCIHHLKVSTL